ncbi:hypothetical protein UMM65_11580 [Aureibaculum sp. 2210JD6-5]|uniref:hypothetical protein n=1 Tax=Aureibaculum sp. 2210JD6-5 TaxID=3103957 RepID=UPI002AAC7E3E|nr:hypothetical protein [Aureibaculum sp. 2210JD6-5]MDY7395888.1 hypothetical protein [Aureibaculum sp. 2210JD6-5]
MFKIGEIVVCVDARRRWYKLGNLKEKEMYTVVGFNPYDDGLILKETKSLKSGYNAYARDRFRKVDYNFAERILNDIKEEYRQTEQSSQRSEKSK